MRFVILFIFFDTKLSQFISLFFIFAVIVSSSFWRGRLTIRDVKAVIFQTLLLPLPHLSLPLPPTKNEKRPLTIFKNFCGSVACLLLHFIILRKQKPSFIAITLPTSIELIFSNYSVFVFLRYQNLC